MAQVNPPDIQSSGLKYAQNLLFSVGASFGPGSTPLNIFSDMLSQAQTAQTALENSSENNSNNNNAQNQTNTDGNLSQIGSGQLGATSQSIPPPPVDQGQSSSSNQSTDDTSASGTSSQTSNNNKATPNGDQTSPSDASANQATAASQATSGSQSAETQTDGKQTKTTTKTATTTSDADDGQTDNSQTSKAMQDSADQSTSNDALLQAAQAALGLMQHVIDKKSGAFGLPDGTSATANDGTSSAAASGAVLAAVNSAAGLTNEVKIKGGAKDIAVTTPSSMSAAASPAVENGTTASFEATSAALNFLEQAAQTKSNLSDLIASAKSQGATTPIDPQASESSTVDTSFLSFFDSAHFSTPTVNAINFVNPTNVAVALTNGSNSGAQLDLNSNNAGNNNTAGSAAGLNVGALSETVAAENTTPVGSYSFASQLSAARATAGGTVGLPSAVDQVALQLNRSAKDGVDQMTIQLRPAEMGRIDIKLNFSTDGKVQGTVVADNPATLDLLLKDVRSLERGLQDAGFSADSGSLQFSLRGDGQQASSSFNQETTNRSNSNLTTNTPDVNNPDLPASFATETYYLTPGRVNIRI